MENLLLHIVKDASSSKYAEIRNTCQELHDFLEAQQGSLRASPHELREKCMNALKMALESHSTKLIAHSITGFQKLLRDDRFQSGLECELEEQWLPSQILLAIGSIKNHSEEVQIDLLKILLNMACTTWWSMNEGVILRILRICQEAYTNSSQATKIAAQATASQTLWAFCDHLREEEKASQKNPYLFSSSNNGKDKNDSPFDSIVPVLQYLCRKLQQKPRNNNSKERVVPFYLESLLSLVSSLPESALTSYLIQDFLWKEFCPTLLALLGPPKADKNASAQKSNTENQSESHRSSNVFATSPVLTSIEAKTVYNIAVELVRLAGPFVSLRPMLESMFHRILLHTLPSHRLEALRATKEILKKPERLLNFGGPPLYEDKASCSTDLGLLKLAIDAFVECSHCSDTSVCYQSVDCVVCLLDSLEQTCAGKGILPKQVNLINSLYQSLESSDYLGPMTYQTWEKLKKLEEIQQEFIHAQSEAEEDTDASDGSAVNENKLCCVSGVNNTASEDDDDIPDGSGFSTVTEDISSENQEDKIGSTSDANGNHVLGMEDWNSNVNAPCSRQPSSDDRDTPSGYGTDSSGSTEGPEEGFDGHTEADEQDEEIADIGAEDRASRWQRLPKTLLGSLDAEVEAERVAKLYETRDLYTQQERNNAHHFTNVLKNLLPKLLLIKSSIEADDALQQFASKYCEEVLSCQNSTSNSECVPHHMIVNADGIYLAIYSSLVLNLKLVHSNYYEDRFQNDPPLTEDEFIDSVHGSGVLVYLSATWLAELYQQVLIYDFLTQAGYSRTSHENSALINLLTDLTGLNSVQAGAFLLSDYFRLERAVTNAKPAPEIEAGQKFARRVLTGCWDGILEVLSVLLNGKNAVGISGTLGLMLGIEGAKEEHRRARDAIANCLNGLQKAARLSNVLNVHSRCEAVFSLLATVSCPVADSVASSLQGRNKKLKSSVLTGRGRLLKLHASHVLSMDVILSRGLELGSHSPDCWKHIFRCCVYLSELEHMYFSKGLPTSSSTAKLHPPKDTEPSSKPRSDVFSDETLPFPLMSLNPLVSPVTIPELVKSNVTDMGTGILSPEQSLQILCALLLQADRLFDDAAYKLNLKSLLGFLNALCSASQSSLFSSSKKRSTVTAGKGDAFYPTNLSLLHHVGDVMLKCVRSGRPLIHVMQAWSVVGLHLMEAACHKDQVIAKKAVTSIHDIVNALLANQSELPYFHFNEALFKPFENLLCLELCDNDIQDQIISSICEFVEGCTTEIRSGWRPLFGALRAVRPTTKESVHDQGVTDACLSPNHIQAVIDVFEAFLNTNNVLVFANAAVDCILCLLKHIKGENCENDAVGSSGSLIPAQANLCLSSLKYIHSCCSILASMQEMTACPIFHASNRIQLNSSLQFIDPEIPGLTFVNFLDEDNLTCNDETTTVSSENEKCGLKFSNTLTLETLKDNVLPLEQMEHPSGILHIWCLILEGLVGAVVAASQKYQSCIMETLFDLLKNIYELPGVEFGLYIINRLLLPMMQTWLRRTARIYRGWDNFAAQFKQCCGQATDLVVYYMTRLAESDHLNSVCGIKLMLYQLLQLMIECITQPTESISRLGCSCIRHVIVTSGPILTSEMWEIICQALCSACTASLFSVKQLMEAFHADSDNFYGDIGQVKVAAKPDCTPEENERLKQLAQQVFLLDNQRSISCRYYLDDPIDDDRSYIFLLYPPNAEHSLNPEIFVVKVPFRSLVVGLLSHQILLQIIGAVLLQGLPHIVPSLANILLQSPVPASSSTCKSFQNSEVKSDDARSQKCPLPGMMQYLSHMQLLTLLDCLEDSYETASKFDARPGLKFLVQKVAGANAAANLYKQMGASWTIHTVVLLELCLHYQQWNMTNKHSKRPVDAINGDDNAVYISCKLKSTLSSICSRYAELFVNKDEDCFDRLQDQPIFFLVAQTEDYMEMRHKNYEDESTISSKLLLKDKISPPPEERAVEENGKSETNDDSPESAHDILAELGNESNEDEDTQVYSVATQKDIDLVMSEFKRRKQQHVMPTGKRDKRKSLPVDSSQHHRVESHETKLPSVLKDREAHIKACTEMLLSIFDFFCQLDDNHFKSLLPIFFPFVCSLVAHGNDSTLRQTLAEFLDRIAMLYNYFNTEG